MPSSSRRLRAALAWSAALPLALLTAGCPGVGGAPIPPSPTAASGARAPTTATPASVAHAIVPIPATVQLAPADSFTVDTLTAILYDADAALPIAALLDTILERTPAARRIAAGDSVPANSIRLRLDAGATALGAEGYELTVARDRVTLVAQQPAGLFYGVQTIRQLLPWYVEHKALYPRRVLRMPAGRVSDMPRFEWRGAMLDVARHFLPAADVKRYIDAMALYKLNRLHLHLSDDQGWRVEIRSWPNLTRIGGASAVGGGTGGFYTQAELRDLVEYAQRRFVMVVPEIDMPGHTNAALTSYAGLNCDGKAPPAYAGVQVGFSVICVDRDSTYKFIGDVVREIGALMPATPYFHIGGDEVSKLAHPQYLTFVTRAQDSVRAAGKIMIGWGEVAPASLHPSSLVQHWKRDSVDVHAARGGRVILSPARKVYLDMKYDSTAGQGLGLRWAGIVSLRTAYDWDPATLIEGVPERSVIGVEAPLWSETLEKREDFEFMAFPRLIAVAELGWSPRVTHDWESFVMRLGGHGARLQAMGVNYHRAPEVPWRR